MMNRPVTILEERQHKVGGCFSQHGKIAQKSWVG